MSGIGEFLREIMPSWLNRTARNRSAAWPGRGSTRHLGDDDARSLAREADALWQRHIDQGLHCEAFPDSIDEALRKRGEAGPKREKPKGSNGLH